MGTKIKSFVGRLTNEETCELATAALDALPEEDAVTVVCDWIVAHGLQGEFDADMLPDDES